MNLRFVAILAAYVFTSTAGLILMRSELRPPEVVLVSVQTLTNWRLLLAFVLYASSFAFWLLAVSRYELTTAYPVFIGVGYASVTFFGVLILGERFDVLKGAGIGLIGLGLLMVATR